MNVKHLDDFQKGMIIPVNKPYTWTSTDVVRKVKYQIERKLRESESERRKMKVGHAGTLDPLASGLVIVCTGKATKLIENIQSAEKEYIAEIEFGKTTPSYDLETDYDAEFPTDHISLQTIEKILPQFTGEITQYPPVFSAKNINGKRAYSYARKGEKVEMRPNLVHIKKLEIVNFDPPHLTLQIRCGKGTYIRSLAHDLGKALNSGAFLKGLIRTRIGEYELNNAISIENFEKKIASL